VSFLQSDHSLAMRDARRRDHVDDEMRPLERLPGVPVAIMNTYAFPRVFPFAVFMAFIMLEEGVRFLLGKGAIAVPPVSLLYLYPVRACAVAVALAYVLPRCSELRFPDFADIGRTTVSILAGLLIFVAWIHMDWSWGAQGKPPSLNPFTLPGSLMPTIFVAVRLFGAVILVPVIEELFWRSFLTRYLIRKEFAEVPIGSFTWPSFLFSTILFGLEHHFIIAGIMAGAVFNLILYRTKSIAQCIIAHSVANLALSAYVLATGAWYFW